MKKNLLIEEPKYDAIASSEFSS